MEPSRAADPCAAHELEDRLRRHRLARARFADDADGLTGGDVERHAADGVHVPVLGRKGHRGSATENSAPDVIELTSLGDELAIVHTQGSL